MTVNNLAASLGRALGSPIAPRFDAPRQGEVRDSQADISLAAKLLGWKPRIGVDEGLRKTVEWYLSN